MLLEYCIIFGCTTVPQYVICVIREGSVLWRHYTAFQWDPNLEIEVGAQASITPHWILLMNVASELDRITLLRNSRRSSEEIVESQEDCRDKTRNKNIWNSTPFRSEIHHPKRIRESKFLVFTSSCDFSVSSEVHHIFLENVCLYGYNILLKVWCDEFTG